MIEPGDSFNIKHEIHASGEWVMSGPYVARFVDDRYVHFDDKNLKPLKRKIKDCVKVEVSDEIQD
jgi:hypothetical protein